ncbi:MAG: LptA/OstA family protein [Rhizobiaceae bacterium]
MAADRRFIGLAAVFLMVAAPAFSQQGSGPVSGIKLSGDEPIQIESDRLEVHDKDSLAIFTGNVTVVQGETLLKSGRMSVYYLKAATGSTTRSTPTAGSSDIDRIELDGTVYIKSQDQVATGERGSFDMKTEIFVLTGEEVVLSQGDNVLVGCKLVANMKTGKAEVEGCPGETTGGRVKMLLKPGSQTQ